MTSIDGLLQDTWLFVIYVKNGGLLPEYPQLHQQGITLVEKARQYMDEQGFSAEKRDHINWVQCAFLDETVLNRPNQPTPNSAWLSDPLQVHFFSSMDAGNQFYERIRQLLRQPAPDLDVLTSYHRALTLGFMGKYIKDGNNPERQSLLDDLSKMLPRSNIPLAAPILISQNLSSRYPWLHSAWLMAALAVLVVTGLSWGLHAHLQFLLNQWISG